MKFKTPYNSNEFPIKAEKNKMPSKTIPDQTMSIKEILIRHSRGLPISGGKMPIYEGEDNAMPDMDRMELTDKMDLIQNNRDEIKRIQADLQKQANKPPKQPKKPESNTITEAEIVKDDTTTDPPK